MSDVDLREILKLEQLEVNLFRGFSPQVVAHRIFGGQVIAQALLAAYATVEERICHSLHAYFIRPGDSTTPIIFEVDRSRDGGSFTTRRVIAVQHGRQIFNLAASFQAPEAGLEHQSQMPDAAPPESFPDIRDILAASWDAPPTQVHRPWQQPIETRFVEPATGEGLRQKLPPRQRTWFRARQPVGDDLRWQQAVLAYASDLGLIGAAMRPHGLMFGAPDLQEASLDHAMWFHRPTDVSRWHLFDMDSPSSSGGRGLNRGAIYREDGTLVASCAQEGLMRVRKVQ